ncbi:hypothetical protein AAEO56_07450 [Flavobacterium sp. DGU11]|uniref:Uncharacterized protein n=1 Tax=Flavobacterium arundinis TaxID=3139143 RepID=A0ABU9HWJ7_9FLAO
MKYLLYIILFLSLPIFSQDIEGISWDEAKISDKMTLTLSKAEFDKRFKKADSITDPTDKEICGREEEATVKMVHYKGAKFELDNGIMNFRSIDFTKNRNTWFSIKDNWFDRTTTLKSFTKDFPASASFVEDVTDADGDILEMVAILPKGTTEDYEWRFYFRDEKLIFLECWFPCN